MKLFRSAVGRMVVFSWLISLVVVCGMGGVADAQETGPPDAREAGERVQSAIEAASAAQAAVTQAREAGPSRARVPLFMVGNQQGRFAEVSCRDSSYGVPYLAAQHGYYAELARASEAGEHEMPVALNLGDSTFPGALSRYLLAASPNGQTLAQVLGRIPWDAHAVGNRELALDDADLERFAKEAQDATLPLQSANLTCTGERQGSTFCDTVGSSSSDRAFRIVERGDVRFGVTSVLHPEASELISRQRMEGLEIREPGKVLDDLIPRMREAGADIVVVLYHSVQGRADLRARTLAAENAGIDVLVSSETLTDPVSADSSTSRFTAGYMVAPQTGGIIVEANSGHRRVVSATLELEKPDGGGWRVVGVDSENVSVEEATPEPETERHLRELSERFCADWGQPINANLKIDGEWSLADFQQFLLNVMRFASHSEVALYNVGAFRNGSRFPISGSLTLADIYAVIPFNNAMVVGRMTGAALTEVSKNLGAELLAGGMTRKEDGTVLINGRPINKERVYRVAMNRYVASGGDKLIDPAALQGADEFTPGWADEPPIIADLVIRWVEQQADELDREGVAPISPSTSFPDLHRRPLWTFVGSVDAAYNQLTVDNPQRDGAPAYDQSQLTVNSADQINLEGNATVEADTRNHGWKTDFFVQYAQASVESADGVTDFEETKDLIRLKSLYQFSGFRSGRWYVPSPYVEGQGESEFDAPDTRDWHKLLLTGIVGARFELIEPLDVKVGFNARSDVNRPDAQADFGLTTAYNLNRTSLASVLGRPIEFQSELEYFYNSITQDNIHELRSTSRLYYAFFGKFFFTTTFRAFAFRTDPVGEWGTNTELTFGLNYRFDATVQSF